jgi:hypothetical protein
MVDATHLKTHRAATSLFKKGPILRRIGRTKGGLNSKLHPICDNSRRPLVMLLSEGQMSDCKDAELMSPAMSGQTTWPTSIAVAFWLRSMSAEPS